ncbi:MAG TPA: hypothetical protein VHW23_12015 [Kofleriaceae bacterium]|jgi:hypothetical protein|nr:hypothetical protein [Kofleriaceae bacterium]
MRVTFGAVLVCIAACAPEFDATRMSDSNSLGERMVTLLCKRLAFEAEPTDVRGDHFRAACAGGDVPADAPPTLVALLTQRPALIKAIDTSIPDPFTDELQAFLTSDATLALYDNDTMSRSIASLADLLDEVSRDGDAMGALAHVATRDGYRPATAAFGIPAALALARSSASGASGAPGTPSLQAVLIDAIPVLTAGGAAHAEWDALVAALSATLLDVAPASDAGSPERTLALARDLLLTEHADLTEPAPVPLVRRDPRGVAQVALVGGALPAPFVDTDGDQLADVDALGRFVDAQGAPLAPAPPAPFAIADDMAARDAQGRVSTYDYVDLSRTVIGAVGHDVSRLFDPAGGPSGSIAFDVMRGASALLGPRVMATRAFTAAPFPYLGYDTTQSPLLDLLYGWSQLLRDPNVGELLDLAQTLLADHSAASARFLEAAITTARLGDAHPEAQVLPGAPMWDELIPIVRQILAQPALVEALFDAFQQPAVGQLGQRLHDLMTFSDRFDIDSRTQVVTGSFTQKPDRTQPDTGFNRSVFQRFLHLIHDSSHVQMCNKEGATVSFAGSKFGPFAACDLIQIDNLATFYLDAIAFAEDATGATVCEDKDGNVAACSDTDPTHKVRPRSGATLVFKDPMLAGIIASSGDQSLELTSTITGFRRHPTPGALDRVLFLSPTPTFLATAIDPVVDASGALFRTHHPGTLPVLEVNGFFSAIRPIIQAFVNNGAEQQFVDLMSVMHKYWPSQASTDTQTTDPAAPNYAFGGNARSWEPLLADGASGDLLPALVDNAAELDAITVNGKRFATVLGGAATFAISPLAGLTDRQGRTTTTTADGQPVTELTPWHVLADAYLARRARLDATAAEGKAWESAVSGVVDVLFRASNDGTGWAFRNPRIRPVSHWVIEFLRGRIAAHNQAGDLATWLTQTLPDNARDTLTHPVLAAAADLAVQLTAQGAPRTALEALLRDAFDEAASPALFGMLRTGSADLIQIAFDDGDLVPVAHLVGRLIAPDRPYLATQLNLVQSLAAADRTAVLARLVGQLFTGYDTADPGVAAIAAIGNGTGEVDRQHPGSDLGIDWTRDDFVSVFGNIAAFLRDQQRGFPRFISIIKGRTQ